MKTIIKHQKGETEVEIIYQKDIFILHTCTCSVQDNLGNKYNISVYNAATDQHCVILRLNNATLGRKIIKEMRDMLSDNDQKILITEIGEKLKPIFEKIKPIMHKYFRSNNRSFCIHQHWYRHSKHSYCYLE